MSFKVVFDNLHSNSNQAADINISRNLFPNKYLCGYAEITKSSVSDNMKRFYPMLKQAFKQGEVEPLEILERELESGKFILTTICAPGPYSEIVSGAMDRLLFRDYLRTHPEAVAEYAKLKRQLAALYGSDREKYTESKADFIKSITRTAISKANSAI